MNLPQVMLKESRQMQKNIPYDSRCRNFKNRQNKSLVVEVRTVFSSGKEGADDSEGPVEEGSRGACGRLRQALLCTRV